MNKFERLFPDLKSDFRAGLVVYLVALPLCLGVALASTGRTDLLFSGIIAGVIGGTVVALISGSPLGVSGPAAGLILIVLNALDTLGSFEAFLAAVVLSGVIQILAGLLRAGVIGYFFPSSVIKGMLAAIGITLILKEIPRALGFDEGSMGDEFFFQTQTYNTITGLYQAFLNPRPGAVIISVFSLALLFLFDRPFMKRVGLFRFLPGALFVVLSGVAVNQLFESFLPSFHLSGKHLVNLPVARSFDEFLVFLRFPDFSAFGNPKLYEIAFTLAVVASLETLLSVEATDKLDPQKRNTPTDRELKAQGVGNVLSGLIGGLPITQVVVRSSANVESGGKTKMSAVIHGLVLLVTALLIPSLLNFIPLASLAAILLMVGYKLSKVSLYRSMFRLGWNQFIPFAVTIVAVLFTDLLRGIGLGMLTALVYILLRNYRTTYMVSVIEEDGIRKTLLKFPEEVTFLNKASIQANLYQIPENSHLIIDGTASQFIHYDVLEIIQEFKTARAPSRRIMVETRGIPEVEVMSH